MRKTAVIMSMTVVIEVTDKNAKEEDFNEVFSYFHYIDKKFSIYKKDSEISQINRGEIKEIDYSLDMKKVLMICEKAKLETNGFFDINFNGKLDPTGLVKGYAIKNGADILLKKGYKNIYVEIAGDIQVLGKNKNGENWKIGLENPFNTKEIIKVVELSNRGIATSGEYKKQRHIYNPIGKQLEHSIKSVSVIAKDILEADRFATSIYAMGEEAYSYIVTNRNFECYIIRKDKTAVYTPGFTNYIN